VDTAIVVTVPLSDIFAKSYCYFYELHGCTIENTGKCLHNMRLYRFAFPGSTQKEPGGNGCYLLKLPSGLYVDVTPTPEGHCYLYVGGMCRVRSLPF